MLTENEMLIIANKYIAFIEEKAKKEILVYTDKIVKKPYGNIYFYDSKKYIETGIFSYRMLGNSPFLIEKKTGRVVNFGTAMDDDYYIEAYEKGELELSADRYWYPDTETFSYE